MFFFFAVFLSVFAVVKCNFKCPKNGNSTFIDGTYGDPENCGIYYECKNGTAHRENCPSGLHFEFSMETCKYKVCVDPSISGCKDTRNEEKSFENCIKNPKLSFCLGSLTNVTECLPNKNETIASSRDCGTYFHCVNGVAWKHQCPTGYFFSPSVNVRKCRLRMCVTSNEANCAIPGGWSSWSDWSECEPSCGGEGIRVRRRLCNNPPPSNGGLECQGN